MFSWPDPRHDQGSNHPLRQLIFFAKKSYDAKSASYGIIRPSLHFLCSSWKTKLLFMLPNLFLCWFLQLIKAFKIIK